MAKYVGLYDNGSGYMERAGVPGTYEQTESDLLLVAWSAKTEIVKVEDKESELESCGYCGHEWQRANPAVPCPNCGGV